MNREELIKIIHDSEESLNKLKTIDYDGLKGKITELESTLKEFKEGGENLLSEDNVLQIGIVGQVKAGKSSFLNSMFFDGENVLPKASTPMTAGLTILEYSDKNTFEVEYFNEKDWEIFVNQDEDYKNHEKEVRAQNPDAPETIIKKEIENRTNDKIRSAHEMVSSCSSKALEKIGKKNDVKPFSDKDDLQNVLEQYVGANGEYTSVVKSLYIKMNDSRLEGLRIVDTPGVNDPVVSRENRTRTFLHSCHGVFLLSASTDFLGSGDVSFLNSRIGGSGIGSVVLLASKFDSVLQDIGAEREMKGEDRGDFGDTVDMQTKKFKKRLRELSDTIDEKLRKKIKLDTTAGIGYSIAHKSSEKWDNIEKQVVQQMKRYYPDYFSSDADIRENFEALANIKEIKSEYLEKIFLNNKDVIISEKINEFFKIHRNEISSTIGKILDDFINRKQQLNNTTIAEIKEQKDRQEKLFNDLKSGVENVVNKFGKSLQSEVNSLQNKIVFNEIKHIPTVQAYASFTFKGAFWGHNTEEKTYDQVDTDALADQNEKGVKAYASAWNDNWKQLFEHNRQAIAESLIQKISEAESDVMSTSFNDKYYRGLVDRILDDLSVNKELKISNIVTTYERMGRDKAKEQFTPNSNKELKDKLYESEEYQVATLLKEYSSKHFDSLIGYFRIIADGISGDMKKEVSKNMDAATSILKDMESTFSTRLKKEGEVYLDRLQEEMKDKKVVLEKLDNIIANLSVLSKLYK